jgi:hypothetical protein
MTDQITALRNQINRDTAIPQSWETNEAKAALTKALALPVSAHDWDKYAECPDCHRRFKLPFGDLFHLHFSVCPECGTAKTSRWRVMTMRWVNPSRLFRPSTWGLGHYETKQ